MTDGSEYLRQHQDHSAKRADHMRARKGHGLSYRELGDEFGVSKQRAHQIVNRKDSDDGEA